MGWGWAGYCRFAGNGDSEDGSSYGGAIDASGLPIINILKSVFVDNQAEAGGAIRISGVTTARLDALFFEDNEAKKKDSVIQIRSSTIAELGLIFLGVGNEIQDDEEDNKDAWEDLNCGMKNVETWSEASLSTADDGLSFWGISLVSVSVVVGDNFCNFGETGRRYIAVCSTTTFTTSLTTASACSDFNFLYGNIDPCTCIDGYTDSFCETAMDCWASEDPTDDDFDARFYCESTFEDDAAGYPDCKSHCIEINPDTPCFFEPECAVGGEKAGWLGCNAMGVPRCRFCGFGDYFSIVCPPEATESPTPAPSASDPDPDPDFVNPIIALTAPAAASSCADITFDATSSSGSGSASGTFSLVSWESLGSSTNPEAGAIEFRLIRNLLAAASEAGEMRVTLPASAHLFASSNTYGFRLTLRNAFGVTTANEFYVAVSLTPAPGALITSPNLSHYRSSPLSLTVDAEYPSSCESCDDSWCTSEEDDCCAPTIFGAAEPRTCSQGNPVETADEPCGPGWDPDMFPQGLYTCCAPAASPLPSTLSYSWTVTDVTDPENPWEATPSPLSSTSRTFTIPASSSILLPYRSYRIRAQVTSTSVEPSTDSLPTCATATVFGETVADIWPLCAPEGDRDACVDDPNGLVALDTTKDCDSMPGSSGLWDDCNAFDENFNGNAVYIYQLCPRACGMCSAMPSASYEMSSTSDSINIEVPPEPLLVSVAGGDVFTSARNTVTMDASGTTDKDVEVQNLEFAWSVEFTAIPDGPLASAVIKAFMAGPFEEQTTSPTFVLPAGSLPEGTTAVFTLTVTSSYQYYYDANPTDGPWVIKTKTGTASKYVTLDTARKVDSDMPGADLPYPEVTTFTPNGGVIVSPNHPLSASISVADESLQYPLALQWTAEDPDLPWPEVFVGSATFTSAALNIDVIPAATPYVFRLSVTDAIGRSTSSTVTVTKNAPPTMGALMVEPPTGGTAMLTSFELVASMFEDPDLPLTYRFFYASSSTTTTTPLAFESNLNSLSSFLPAGELTIGVEVADAFGSSVSTTTIVKVETAASASSTTSLMKDLIEQGQGKLDGAEMARLINVGIESGGECSPTWMLNKLSSAWAYIGGEGGVSKTKLDLVACSLQLATADGLSSAEANKGFELLGTLVDDSLQSGDVNSVGLLLDSMGNVLPTLPGNGNVTIVDGIIGKLWGRALESGQVIPGMDPLTFGADGIAVTAGAYATTAEGVNVTSSLGSWFHFLPAEGAGESQGEGVNAAIVALDTALVGVKDYEGENTAFVSDGVSVSLKNREGSEGSGLDLSQGVVFSIPFSEGSEALRNGTTLDWYKCALDTGGGVWDVDGCEVLGFTEREITCRCLNFTYGRGAPGSRRLESAGDWSLIDDIGGAFLRASAVLSAPITLEHLEEQLIILTLLGGIYIFYMMVMLRAVVKDRWNVAARHKELLESEFVEKAIRAMRENFLRIELANKNDVIDPNHVGLDVAAGELDRNSSSGSMLSLSPRSMAAKTMASTVRGGQESLAGLDAFTNRRLTRQQLNMSQKYLSRGSTSESFDEENDGDILTFLSTSERRSEERAVKKKISGGYSFDFGDDHTTPGGSGSARNLAPPPAGDVDSDDETTALTQDRLEMAEQAAAVEQEEKLKRFRKNKMAQFWNGIKQEHDFFVVFSGNGGGRRRSTATNNGKNATPASTLFSSAPSDKKTSSAATTKRSTTSSSGGEGGGGSEPRRSSILTGVESMQQKLDTAEAHRAEAHRAEALQDLEEYVNIAHRSTVLLCQFLSFLAMAVFFYEEDESLLSGARWDEIGRADTGKGMRLVSENILEGFVQVLLTFPVTWLLITLFKQLDQAGTAKVLFESRVANDQAKLLHGISQDNPVDLRRSIHEVEGLLRIAERSGSVKQRKQDVMVVKYTLDLLKKQLLRVRQNEKMESDLAMERIVAAARSKAKSLSDVQLLKDIRTAHKLELRRRREVEDVLVKMCSLDSVRQALFLKDRRAMNHMTGRSAGFKRYMYKSFIAEKEGFVPNEVGRFWVWSCETIAFLFIAFLTFYLYKYALVMGQATINWAVGSFALEILISALAVSPMYIFIKVVVMPSLVASLVEVDVKTAQAQYREKMKMKRQKAGLGLGGERRTPNKLMAITENITQR
ncbi:hypothetical protein TeGR_g8763, partial [Tetraparma gracilis]